MDAERWDVIRGSGPDGGFIELWDRSLAPEGLAFEAFETSNGGVAVIGHGVQVPLAVVAEFMELAVSSLTVR